MRWLIKWVRKFRNGEKALIRLVCVDVVDGFVRWMFKVNCMLECLDIEWIDKIMYKVNKVNINHKRCWWIKELCFMVA